jgi:hypothetical protein
MNIKLVSRSIAVVTKLREIFKNDKDRSDQISEYAQFFIDRFNDSIKLLEKQIDTEVVQQSLENVRILNQHQRQSHGKDLDTNLFYENCI